jgi:hypothetical protein
MTEIIPSPPEASGVLANDALEKKSDKKRKKAIPASLPIFLQSDCPVSAYVAALEKGGKATKRPDQADRDEAVSAVLVDPSLLPKVTDLARTIFETSQSLHLAETVKRLASDIIRAQDDELSGWGNNGGFSADAELGKLAARLRTARVGGEKLIIQQAEHLLQLGLVVVSNRSDFNPTAILLELNRKLTPTDKNEKPQKPNDRAKREIVRSSLKHLDIFGAITAAVTLDLKETQRQFALANAQIVEQIDRLKTQRVQLEAQKRELDAHSSEMKQLTDELETLRRQVRGIEGGRDDDLNVLRARFRKFLNANLSELIGQAHEALSSKPPALDIAEVLLDDAMNDIKKELRWLNQHQS